MALPGSLNRYLLLMAQEHLEFRLPVSRPGVHDAEARTPHAPAWGALRAAARAGTGAGVRSVAGPRRPKPPFARGEPALPFNLSTCAQVPQLSRRT